MTTAPFMPKATAKWLIENSTLTFEQIAAFTQMHPLEIQGIADGDVAGSIQPNDPIKSGELTREEIERCEKDDSATLKMNSSAVEFSAKKRKGARYTPVARRQDKPDAIAWILKHHPEFADSQIVKLIGTTKKTIEAIRERTYWNINNLNPRDPVLLGLCTQTALNNLIEKSKKNTAA